MDSQLPITALLIYSQFPHADMMALVTLPEKLNDTDWKQKVTNKALLITHWIYDEHKIEVFDYNRL